MLHEDSHEENSSTTGSTLCVTSTDSAADSLNSLLESQQDGGLAGDCLDVNVKCSLSNQCPVSCEEDAKEVMKKSFCCNAVIQTVWGVLLVLVSIGGFIFTPQDFMLLEKLNMRPGFPPFEWWADPPDEVRLRFHVFNYTNHLRFLSGQDAKLNVEELGPIVYLEKLIHYNVSFNENSTLTYTAKRQAIFLPDENTIDMNATVIIPNLAVLGLASYLHDANFLVQGGFRLLVSSLGSALFTRRPLQQLLWELRDPVLSASRGVAPALVPVDNVALLARIYQDFTDEVTVKVGPQWGHQQFFHIDQFRGEAHLPGYDPADCPGRQFGATEGVMYSQHLRKDDVLLYWRKTVCKIMPLYFDAEFTMNGIPVYRYNLTEEVHSPRFAVCRNDTHSPHSSYPPDSSHPTNGLPPGVSDASKCYYGFPMVTSFPHFYAGGVTRDHYVTGLRPDPTKHNSYAVVEPVSGTPTHSVARMQSNLLVRELRGFPPPYRRFDNLVLPLCWAEYSQEGLPARITNMLYFMVVVLPPLSACLLTTTLLLGIFLLLRNLRPSGNRFSNMRISAVKDGKSFYEKQGFLTAG